MMPNDRFGNVYCIAVNSPLRKLENDAFAQARFVPQSCRSLCAIPMSAMRDEADIDILQIISIKLTA